MTPIFTLSKDKLRHAIATEPALTLLAARTRDWVLPLFSEIEALGGSVGTENFHIRIEEVLADQQQVDDTKITPAERCRKWVEAKWLDIRIGSAGSFDYMVTPHTRRVLEFIRALADNGSSVTGARFKTIAFTVHELASMVNPDRSAQVKSIERQIEDLVKRRNDIASGRARLATIDEMRNQLHEVLSMTNSLPADFDSLRKIVEERHQAVSRRAFTDAPTKAELVDDYLRENDLLTTTPQGLSYEAFSQMLISDEAQMVQSDIDGVLKEEFGTKHMSSVERDRLDTMMTTLLASEYKVRQTHQRWTASLRRLLSRQPPGRRQQLIRSADRALAAGTAWVEADPGARSVANIIGIGGLEMSESSDVHLWRHTEAQEVRVEAAISAGELPDADRAAMRLAAGTSINAVAETIDFLLDQTSVITGRDVYENTPAEFRRLGFAVSLLSLAITHGELDASGGEDLLLEDGTKTVTVPRVAFIAPITLKKRNPQ